jgi:hypothetical protein
MTDVHDAAPPHGSGPCQACVERALDEWVQAAAQRLDVRLSASVRAELPGLASVTATSDPRALRCLAAEDVHGARALGTVDGPSAEAAQSGEPRWSDDLRRERRWPRWTRVARSEGVAGVLSLPHVVAEGPALIVTLLADEPGAWTPDARDATAELVEQLVPVLHLALQVEQASRDLDDVDSALRTRATIDQAVGVVMAHHRCSSTAALARLRRASQSTGVPLADLAAHLVTDVAGEPPTEPTAFRRRAAS